MNDLEEIDNYFLSNPMEEEKLQFEKRIVDDAAFAEKVAFYISTNEVLKQVVLDQKKQRFREIYNREKEKMQVAPVRSLWRYLAAAAVVGILALVSWFFIGNKSSVEQLAGMYIQQNFQELPGTMGMEDSLQVGIKLFNEQKLTEALTIFQALHETNPGNAEVKKYAGITSLRTGQYDNALHYFTLLESETNLTSNPGKFYKAITFLKRNGEGDKAKAQQLLQEVVDQKGELNKVAEDWLKKF